MKFLLWTFSKHAAAGKKTHTFTWCNALHWSLEKVLCYAIEWSVICWHRQGQHRVSRIFNSVVLPAVTRIGTTSTRSLKTKGLFLRPNNCGKKTPSHLLPGSHGNEWMNEWMNESVTRVECLPFNRSDWVTGSPSCRGGRRTSRTWCLSWSWPTTLWRYRFKIYCMGQVWGLCCLIWTTDHQLRPFCCMNLAVPLALKNWFKRMNDVLQKKKKKS